MFLERSQNRIGRILFVSCLLLLGVLIGLLLPAQGSTVSTSGAVHLGPRSSESGLLAVAGDLPASAHLTLWEIDDVVALPLVLR